jgi:Tol biopolymer transport system component
LSTRLALAAAVLLAAGAASAQGYDPAFHWRTIDTPHFQIHFHQGEEALADVVAHEAERAHALLVPLLGHAPAARTQVVLSDDVDDANGSATPVPYNTMRLFAVPPSGLSELNDFRDWVATLVVHEYVHILHVDAVGGVPRVGNRIFGRLFFPNGMLPRWLVEGLAVLHEAEGAPGFGRNASALYGMYARALALEGAGLPNLDDVTNPSLEWPRGQLAYLLGGRFLRFLRERRGDAAIREFVLDQGARIWPWAPSAAGRRAFGHGFPELWNVFREEETAHHRAQLAAIRTRPVTRPRALTFAGGRVDGPRWSPDGRVLAWFHAGLDDRPGIYRLGADGVPLGRGAIVEANGAFALRSEREAIAAIGEVWREHRLYDDLWRVDLVTGKRERITRGERATDPDLGADGRTLVYVVRPGPGRLALVRRDLRSGARETLLDRAGTLVYAPRVSPDGGRVAFELQEDGRRDVALWEDGAIVRLTDDDAIDVTPAWSADGRWLFFASDRGGVYNVYAWDVETRTLRQVTNVETGALEPAPSPDGKTLVFATYSRAGYDLASVPLDEATWLEPESATVNPCPTPVPVPPSPCPVTAAATPGTVTDRGDGDGPPPGTASPLSSRPYRPWRTILPRYWLPLLSSDAGGTIAGLSTSGSDVVGEHAWALQGWWGFGSERPGYSAAYLGGWSWPRLDVSSSRFIGWSPGFPDRHESVWTPIDAGVSFTFSRLARALALRLGWSGTIYDTVGALEPEPDGIPPAWRFEDGFLSEASLLATYSDAKATPNAISAEEGRSASIGLRLAKPGLGSDFDLWRTRGALTQYARLGGHSVLALRFAGGIGRGSLGGRAPFRLGGVSAPDPLAAVLLGTTGSSDQLRGYESGRLRGNAFVLANVELRVPIAAPQAGRSTWPVFLRRVHGAVFVDAGDAFETGDEPGFDVHPFRWDAIRFGAGAELRAETFIGYYLPLEVRLGVAHGLGRLLRGEGPREDPAAVPQLYLTVGASY